MRDEWYVARRGEEGSKRYGPVPLVQLRELLETGKVRGEDLVWRDGMGAWERADRCRDLTPAPGYAPADRRPRPGPPRHDDRPFPRRDAAPPSSGAGWVIGLAIAGGVAVLGLLTCGGVLYFIGVSARPAPMTAPYNAFKPFPVAPPAPVPVANADVGALCALDAAGRLGQELNYNTSELFYTVNVTPQQAQSLGTYLNGRGVFPVDHGVTVQLDFLNAAFVVRFCVQPNVSWQNDAGNYYSQLRSDIQQFSGAFWPGAVVQVELCDEQMNTVRTITGP